MQWLCAWLWRRPWRWPRLLAVLPCLLRFLAGKADHGELKGQLLHATLGGIPRAALAAHSTCWAQRFAQHGCFDDALAAIRAHRSQQDRLVLMSASVDTYVPVLARALGFDECICSPAGWRADGRYDGRLTGPNCRGEEKVRQFRTRHAREPQLKTWAYGNSAHDLPHLQLADRAYLVNAPNQLRKQAASLGVDCVDWR